MPAPAAFTRSEKVCEVSGPLCALPEARRQMHGLQRRLQVHKGRSAHIWIGFNVAMLMHFMFFCSALQGWHVFLNAPTEPFSTWRRWRAVRATSPAGLAQVSVGLFLHTLHRKQLWLETNVESEMNQGFVQDVKVEECPVKNTCWSCHMCLPVFILYFIKSTCASSSQGRVKRSVSSVQRATFSSSGGVCTPAHQGSTQGKLQECLTGCVTGQRFPLSKTAALNR